MKKFRAIIHEFDRDYNAFSGSEEIRVGSWKEAEAYCQKHNWSGHDYMVYGLIDDSIAKGYFSKKEFTNRNKPQQGLPTSSWSYL